MEELNQAPEMAPRFVGEQAVTGSTRAYAKERGGSGIFHQGTFLMYI